MVSAVNKGLFGNRNPDKYASGEVVFSANQPGPGFVAANGLRTPRYQRGINKNFGDRMVNGGYASPIWATVQGYFSATAVTSVAFGNGLWVAAGQGNQLRTSTDAITWATQTLNIGLTGTTTPRLAFGNNIWVALTSNPSTFGLSVRTSTDAITWTTRTIGGSGTFAPASLVFQNNIFVGTVNGSGIPIVARSTDGITWTTAQVSYSGVVRGAVFGAGRWVLPSTSSNFLYTSTDAITWTPTSGAADTDSGAGIAFGNNIFVMGLSTGVIRTSTDGLVWVTRSTTIPANADIIFHSPTKQFFAYSTNGYLARSFDGLNWTTISTNFGTRTINTLAIQNNIWVAGGTSGAIHRGDARMSYVLPNTANAWVKS